MFPPDYTYLLHQLPLSTAYLLFLIVLSEYKLCYLLHGPTCLLLLLPSDSTYLLFLLSPGPLRSGWSGVRRLVWYQVLLTASKTCSDIDKDIQIMVHYLRSFAKGTPSPLILTSSVVITCINQSDEENLENPVRLYYRVCMYINALFNLFIWLV